MQRNERGGMVKGRVHIVCEHVKTKKKKEKKRKKQESVVAGRGVEWTCIIIG